MSKDWGQLGDIARLFVRLRPNFKWIALASLVVGLIAGIYVAMTHKPTFVSETIAIVRPQQMLLSRSTEDAQSGEKTPGSLLPHPLDVTDYVLFLQSEGMLTAVSEAYNSYHLRDSERPLGVAQLRRMLIPNSRLEIKTPYTVEYYPTIEMRVFAPSPDKAYDLARLWVEAAKDWATKVTFSAKEETARYLENETGQQRKSLQELADRLNTTKDETNRLLEDLKAERLAIEQRYETETIKMLQETADAWDARIAAAEAEFGIPLLETAIEAKKSILAGLQLARMRKERELDEARAKISEMAAQLGAPNALALLEGLPQTSWEIGLEAGETNLEPLPQATGEAERVRQQEAEKRAARRIEADEKRRTEIMDLLKSYTESTDDQLQDRQQGKIEALLKKLEEETLKEQERLRKRDGDRAGQEIEPETKEPKPLPSLGPEDRRRIESFRVEATGQNPVAVLLQKELSEARVILTSAPLELQKLQLDIDELHDEIASLQARYLAQRKALIMLDRAKEAELETIEKEREYGLEREQRVTEMMVDDLSRKRGSLEEAVQRDHTTASDIFTNLAESHLQAELALANTIDEFQVVSPPTYPESPPQTQFLVYGFATFLASFSVLFVLAAFAVVLRSLIRSIQANNGTAGA